MKTLILSILVFFSFQSIAQSTKEAFIFSTKEGAIKGYDPVAYFTIGKPVKGHKTISHLWEGATWFFLSEANKALFVANPEKYAPRYSGYCAYGWAQGYAVKIEPDAWAIEGGKLYLNYNKKIQKDWDKDRAGYIKKADINYSQR